MLSMPVINQGLTVPNGAVIGCSCVPVVEDGAVHAASAYAGVGSVAAAEIVVAVVQERRFALEFLKRNFKITNSYSRTKNFFLMAIQIMR